MTHTPESLRALAAAATKGPRKGDPSDWYIDWYGLEKTMGDIRSKTSEVIICEYVEAKNAPLLLAAPDLALGYADALEEVARLREALGSLLNAVCGPVGFAEAVRHNTGLALPWPSIDRAEAMARAALSRDSAPETKGDE